MRSKEEYMELLRSYFQNKAKAYGVVKMALFGSVVRPFRIIVLNQCWGGGHARVPVRAVAARRGHGGLR